MKSERRIVGFDRKIQLAWLDATAEWVAEGLPAAQIRSRLWQLLEGQVAGGGSRSARDKTITVLLHIWSQVPDYLVPVRDDALALLSKDQAQPRLPLHWGMCLVTYPFFRDVAASAGRLLQIQGSAGLAQINRRTAELWGQRELVARATRHAVRSVVDWRVLSESGTRGVYLPGRRLDLAQGNGIGPWLVEAVMLSTERRTLPLAALLSIPSLFPFVVQFSSRELASHPRLELQRHGSAEDVVMLRH